MFNVPAVVLWALGLMCAVHLVRVWVLTPEDDRLFVLTFAFIPARYAATLLPGGILPGGVGAEFWTFVSYSLIHADAMHLGLNSIWLVAFGSPVARRFGAPRFAILLLVTAAAGALMHLVTHAGEMLPVVGASGAVSGAMGAATRFVFQRGGPLDSWRYGPEVAERIPAAPLGVAMRNPRVLAFVGVWFAVNLIFGVGSVSIGGGDQIVAWEAHVGGFLAGLLLFPLFDRGTVRVDPDVAGFDDGPDDARPH